jgi:hypothetical protein
VWLSAALPDTSDGPPARWLSALACRGPEQHEVDAALDWIVDALGGELDADSLTDCPIPGCGSVLRSVVGAPPSMLVIGQTEIDPQLRRVRNRRLFYQATVRPGTVFTAEALAFPEQAAVLDQLDEVLVGGNRARGLGRAKARVTAAPVLQPIEERIRRTSAAVRARGIELGEDELAVLGLVSDGFAAEPLRELLRQRGLEMVTGQADTVVHGSYDELGHRPRALRTLLAAGSWVAVRGRDLAGRLSALERDGIEDPDGLQPLWLRVRGDVEANDDDGYRAR